VAGAGTLAAVPGGVGQLGAVPTGDGLVEFRVWAPYSPAVGVQVRGEIHPLDREGECFAGRVEAAPGDDYYLHHISRFWADPCSRFQPDGVRGPSRVVDTARFRAATSDFAGLSLDDLVIYELHIGTFSPEGTFDGAIVRLPELAQLGVTAVELMPIATFPGKRGWGYDGLYTWSPHPAYGAPDAFARFVHAAHECGLGVILDVVYNHVGPGNENLWTFGPYFTDRHETFWGDAIDYTQRWVREWAIQNAEMWTRDYGVDGLRLDAVHAISDDSPVHVCAELAERVRAVAPRTIVTSEMEIGNRRPIEEWGHDAQWEDTFHHALWVLLTGERDGYYAPYGKVGDLARAYESGPPEKLIICAQNHDQVGNRARGDRVRREHQVVAALCTLFAPHSVLLFQGEEYGEERPFLFFTDHIDAAIAAATREGRRKEFASFSGFSGEELPDPQSEETFVRSKLDPSAGNEQLRELYATLMKLRRELPKEVEARADEDARILRVRRGPVELVANFATMTAELRR
jgi:maltooligosyltrehalose trehalohydrolase